LWSVFDVAPQEAAVGAAQEAMDVAEAWKGCPGARVTDRNKGAFVDFTAHPNNDQKQRPCGMYQHSTLFVLACPAHSVCCTLISAVMNQDGLYFHHIDCARLAHSSETQCELCKSIAHTLGTRKDRPFVAEQARNESNLKLLVQELEHVRHELADVRAQLAQPFGAEPTDCQKKLLAILEKLNGAIEKDPEIVSSKVVADFENALTLVNLGTISP